MKKLTFVLLIPMLFFSACTFDTSIPDDNPPTINMADWAGGQQVEDGEILKQVQDDSEDAAISDDAMFNVVIPSEERETQRLLKEYQATLDAINESIE
jgi:hypothetical protein